MQKITPFLWYLKEAEEAARFYTSIFPDSRVTRVTSLPSESPSGPPGSVKIVDFILFGQAFVAMSAGPLDPFNHSISFVVHCATQQEVDHYWSKLTAGGEPKQCGWLTDKFGVTWQITPQFLLDVVTGTDAAKKERVMAAMMTMGKLDLAALEQAASDKQPAKQRT